MLQNIQEIKAVLNELGYFDIVVNGVVVGEMIAKHEIADAIKGVLIDEYGMVADMIKDEADL